MPTCTRQGEAGVRQGNKEGGGEEGGGGVDNVLPASGSGVGWVRLKYPVRYERNVLNCKLEHTVESFGNSAVPIKSSAAQPFRAVSRLPDVTGQVPTRISRFPIIPGIPFSCLLG